MLLRPRSFVGLLHLRPTGQRPPHLRTKTPKPSPHLRLAAGMPLLPSTRPTTSDVFFDRHNAKTAMSSSAQREDGRNSFGSPSAGFDPSSAHSARQLLGFSTQGRSHGLRLFYRLIVTGHLRPMCPRRRWPSAPSLRPAARAATGWFPPEGLLRHSALGGLRQPTPSACDTRSWLRPSATTESSARG